MKLTIRAILAAALLTTVGSVSAHNSEMDRAFVQVWSEMLDVTRNYQAQLAQDQYGEAEAIWWHAVNRTEQILARYGMDGEAYALMRERFYLDEEFHQWVMSEVDSHLPQTYDAYCAFNSDYCTLWVDGQEFQYTRDDLGKLLPNLNEDSPGVDICEIGGLCYDAHYNVIGI